MYKAEIVADSLSPQSHRITTMLVTMPRIILAEFNTHRMLSRNSASSRAIPFKKMVQAVRENPFIPMRWMKDHSGMQGVEYFEQNSPEASDIHDHYLEGRDRAVDKAISLHERGLTKQIVNRGLEPYMWHTVLVTATEWENFFALRVDPAAEIHMQHVAELMLNAMNEFVPKRLEPGEWHIPFEDKIFEQLWFDRSVPDTDITGQMLKISTMMCARTSYTVPGDELSEWTVEKYVEKHDNMLKMGHMSPFEHCARCMDEEEYHRYVNGKAVGLDRGQFFSIEGHGWCGNFRGWIQYRKILPNENRSDSRLIKHSY